VAKSLADYLQRHPEIESQCSQHSSREFYTTDSTEDFDSHASIFYGEKVQSKHLDLDHGWPDWNQGFQELNWLISDPANSPMTTEPDLDQSVKSVKIRAISGKPLPLPSFHKPRVWWPVGRKWNQVRSPGPYFKRIPEEISSGKNEFYETYISTTSASQKIGSWFS